MAAEPDTERSAVKTYVPEYQKRIWKNQAERMDMSLSEFVRSMVQAGRRDFEIQNRGSTGSGDDTPGVEPFESRILDVLSTEGYTSWEELIEEVTGDVEQRIETTLEDLQRENAVAYSGRQGGYTRIDDV